MFEFKVKTDNETRVMMTSKRIKHKDAIAQHHKKKEDRRTAKKMDEEEIAGFKKVEVQPSSMEDVEVGILCVPKLNSSALKHLVYYNKLCNLVNIEMLRVLARAFF